MAVNLLFFSFYDVLVWSILKPDDIGYNSKLFYTNYVAGKYNNLKWDFTSSEVATGGVL